MADKDFQVKNGLVINSNNYGGANKFTVNASALWFGNNSANVSINSTAIFLNGIPFNGASYPGKAATAGLADNTSFVGTVTAANVVSNAQLQANLANYSTTSTIASTYQTMAGLSANVATLTSANSTRLNAKTEGNLNVNNALTANLATFSTTAALVGNNGSATGPSFTFNYTPQLGAPTFVWGTTDGVTFRPYNPANFTATTATTATNVSGGGTVSAVSGSFSSNTLTLGASSLAANGFTRLPNGLLLQWGTSIIINQDSSGSVTFPTAFQTVYNIQISAAAAFAGEIYTTSGGLDAIDSITTTTFIIRHGADGNRRFYWQAIGV